MEAEGDRYQVTIVPIPPQPGPVKLRLTARYANGSIDTSLLDLNQA